MKIEQWISNWGIFNSKLNKENEMPEENEMMQEQNEAELDQLTDQDQLIEQELKEVNQKFDFLSERIDAAIRTNDFKSALTMQKELILLLGPQWTLGYKIAKLKQEQENGGN